MDMSSVVKGLIIFHTRSHLVCYPCSLHLAKEETFPTLKTVAPSGGTSPWRNSAPWWHLLNWKRTVLPQMNSFWPCDMNTLEYSRTCMFHTILKFANCDFTFLKFSQVLVREHSMTHWMNKNLLSRVIICCVYSTGYSWCVPLWKLLCLSCADLQQTCLKTTKSWTLHTRKVQLLKIRLYRCQKFRRRFCDKCTNPVMYDVVPMPLSVVCSTYNTWGLVGG